MEKFRGVKNWSLFYKIQRCSKIKVTKNINTKNCSVNPISFKPSQIEAKIILILYTPKLILHNRSHAKVYAGPGDRNAFSQVIMISVIALVDDEGP
jgi:hypothetical protein